MLRFLIAVVPGASRRLAAIRRRAATIPDARLRTEALASIDRKAYHVQGGSILATFLPRADAARFIDVVAPLESIYDYLDNLCDRIPGLGGSAFATLHEALLDALDARRVPGDYYRDGPAGDDGGYLASLVAEVRAALRAIPGSERIRESAGEIAGYYAQLQTHKHLPPGEREAACRAWYETHRERFNGLSWWEFAAASGSSLPIFALVYAATANGMDTDFKEAVLEAYFPHLSAVHILLDYFIDQAEDREFGELNFIACYPSVETMVARMQALVSKTLEGVRAISGGDLHEFVLRAMCLFYLSHPKVFAQHLEHESLALLGPLT